MTLATYKERLSELKAIAKKQELELGKEYAFANNPYKIGDIIKCYDVTIKIEVINFYNEYPSRCVYKGKKLTKALIPFKSGETDSIYQSTSITKLN